MSPETARLYRTIDYVLPTLPGWCAPEKGKKMAEVILENESEVCVELGVFGGRSLVAIALALKAQRKGRVFGVDPYTAAAALEGTNDPENDAWWRKLDHEQIHAAAERVLDDLELSKFAIILRARSQDASRNWPSIDLLHQDSNHSEEVSCAEVELYAPVLKPGGIWIMDDTNWQTTRKAQDKLLALGFTAQHREESWAILRKPL